jgi:hypothetical protein
LLARRGSGENPLMRALRQLVQRLALSAGYSIERATDEADIRTLMAALRPSSTHLPLIRLGGARDGGYLVPDDLEGIEACFSPGVGLMDVTTTFEEACAARGMKIFLADRPVRRSSESRFECHVTEKLIGPVSADGYLTMEDWVQSSMPNAESDLLLQMDIEGDEYLAIAGIPDAVLRRFRIVVVEFHGLHRLWNAAHYGLARRTFDRLLKHHTCVHIHPNNYAGIRRKGAIEIPEVAEFTFLRNDRVADQRPATTFPHPLDADNSGTAPHIPLPSCWYAVP